MLHEFVTANREEIISRCRAKVAGRPIPPPSEAEINHGVPLFLDQLVRALRSGIAGAEDSAIDTTAGRHGHDLLLKGFTVSQVVHDYGDVCQTITELAVEKNAPIATEDFRTLNRCLDEAIAGAVTTYAHESEQLRVGAAQEQGNERMGFVVHELRNLVNTATIAFEVLQTGNVGLKGSTGAVLDRSLGGLRDLIASLLHDVRLAGAAAAPSSSAAKWPGGTLTDRQHVSVADVIAEVEATGRLAAGARGIDLVVKPVERDVEVDADRQLLVAIVGNLLQNAVKFTRPKTTVTLTAGASADRVIIEVQDECGGLPHGDVDDLFRPFEQRSADRTGVGIGLAFSRWAAEANGGRVYARNLPGEGCVFTLDLPRLRVPAPTA